MSGGLESLDELIQRLRTFGGALPQIAQSLVPVLEDEAAAAIAAQRGMGGEKWPATKDGKPALQNALGALQIEARGTVVLLTLSGHHVWHQYGTFRTPKRPILPSAGLNKRIGNAIRFGVANVSKAFLEREGRHDIRKSTRRKAAR
jgi:hypothetical protein